MDIQDLDFKEVFQKPVDSPFFACHIEGELSNQELKTVLGGSKPVKTVVEVLKPALLDKIATQTVVKKEAISVLVKDKALDTNMGAGSGQDMGGDPGQQVCFPSDSPPYYICLEQSSPSV
jgi:hypothetical protein